ncbi:VOC family protein [Actinomadura rudentiformis]|uniref:VOC family protein n=1 Tax=Actinomadura rudentiformis TaxID=359158 RepID=A0A6H9YVS9_9ACTN|nr:VOC family protein [Actinomadura rudentiformis]KAB2346403.1 VOC family protein [Actinomadura rudentiformis]
MAVSLFAVTLDCPDPEKLARFYEGFLGGRVHVADDGHFAVLVIEGEVRLDFQRADNPAPPKWPDPTAPLRHHLEFAIDEEPDEMERRLRELGASVPSHQPDDDHFRVYVDPAGHLFCVAPRANTYVRED